MIRMAWTLTLIAAMAAPSTLRAEGTKTLAARPAIRIVDPPEQAFFSKVLDYHGILIKAHKVVSDAALQAAYDRLELELGHLPVVVANLAAVKAELHIIGRDQVTTDLPEWRVDKHVPLDEYDGLTRDERTRGMGGLITSCGEENLLRLPKGQDHYFGRDICIHEFAHNIQGCGFDDAARERIRAQAAKSKAKGLWLNSYAGSNEHEYFAELSMWYFGTHGDMGMSGPKPENGPEGLRKYDPEAYALLDDLYQGRIAISKTTNPVDPEEQQGWVPQDSQVARGIVAKLSAYRVGETKLSAFQKDAGLQDAKSEGQNGWHVTPLESGTPGDTRTRIFFRDPKGKDHSLADLDFRSGVLTGVRWNN